MMTVQQRLVALANFIGVPSVKMRAREISDRQFDVFIDAQSGAFRLGYFDANTFIRENPVRRTLARYGVYTMEGAVAFKVDEQRAKFCYPTPVGVEPQYDMVFLFDEDGKCQRISDQRTGMEAEA
jgi:hypothetical protein